MRRRFFASAAAALATLALCVFACSGQGEGQRCDTADEPGGTDNSSGTNDCASNLRCYKASELGAAAAAYGNAGGSATTLGICCPYDRAKNATTAICQIAGFVGDAALPPTDAGGDAPATLTDAADAGDAASDAPADAPSDAPSDASSDAPDAG